MLFVAFFPPTLPKKKTSYKGPILAPRPLTPEMDFSRSLAGHGSQYVGLRPHLPIALASLLVLPL
jgi:hypothetical protein